MSRATSGEEGSAFAGAEAAGEGRALTGRSVRPEAGMFCSAAGAASCARAAVGFPVGPLRAARMGSKLRGASRSGAFIAGGGGSETGCRSVLDSPIGRSMARTCWRIPGRAVPSLALAGGSAEAASEAATGLAVLWGSEAGVGKVPGLAVDRLGGRLAGGKPMGSVLLARSSSSFRSAKLCSSNGAVAGFSAGSGAATAAGWLAAGSLAAASEPADVLLPSSFPSRSEACRARHRAAAVAKRSSGWGAQAISSTASRCS